VGQEDIEVRIGKRGRVVIPAEVRRRLHLRDGDVLALTIDEDQNRLELQPVPLYRIERFRQVAAKYYEGVDVDAALNQLRDEWES